MEIGSQALTGFNQRDVVDINGEVVGISGKVIDIVGAREND